MKNKQTTQIELILHAQTISFALSHSQLHTQMPLKEPGPNAAGKWDFLGSQTFAANT